MSRTHRILRNGTRIVIDNDKQTPAHTGPKSKPSMDDGKPKAKVHVRLVVPHADCPPSKQQSAYRALKWSCRFPSLVVQHAR